MSELDRVVEMFEGDNDVTGKTANISKAIREIKALRGVVEAVKKDEARQPWFVVEALDKLDETRRG
jgi:hypothetical protein